MKRFGHRCDPSLVVPALVGAALRSAGLGCLTVFLAACISTSPPAPAVRWFDPLPPAGNASAAGLAGTTQPVDLRVEAAAHLGREFVVRVAAREIAFDTQHSWVSEPRQLVAAAIQRRLGDGQPGARIVQVHVAAFEFDVLAAPRAHVRLVVHGTTSPREFDVWAPAADRSPESFAAAMGEALFRAAEQVAVAVAAPASAQLR